eukprot:symbB.v1.2.026104.t3/scaffold2578.1/size75865/5
MGAAALYEKEQQSAALQKSLVLAKVISFGLQLMVKLRKQCKTPSGAIPVPHVSKLLLICSSLLHSHRSFTHMGRARWWVLLAAALCFSQHRWKLLPPVFAGGSIKSLRDRPRRDFGGRDQKAVAEDNLLGLDEETVALHRKYHEATITYTAMNIDWAQDKGYENDKDLTRADQMAVAEAARSRLFRWPDLDPQDLHEVQFGPQRHRFCGSVDSAEALGDPGENVFVISQMRRPSRLRHALHELYREGISAKIVDAVDGDGFRRQEELDERDSYCHKEWAERRVPSHLVAEVNRSGFIFITHAPNTRYEAADKVGSGTWRMEQGLGVETLPMVDNPRNSVVRSLVAGVKSLSVGLLGAMLRPLRKAPVEQRQMPENNFYYDPVVKRWRQQGVEDIDVSNIDPSTGRQKQDLATHFGPPPTGRTTTGSLTAQPASLYVDPLAPAKSSTLVTTGVALSAQGKPAMISSPFQQDQSVVHQGADANISSAAVEPEGGPIDDLDVGQHGISGAVPIQTTSKMAGPGDCSLVPSRV